MTDELFQDSRLLQNLINAFPSLSLVVDNNVCVAAFNNTAAESGLQLSASSLKQLTGNVLSCVNAWMGGCGRTRKCRGCDVRLAVHRAFDGEAIRRVRTKMRLRVGGREQDFHLLVSTSSFEHKGGTYVLLVVENITDLVTLQELVPILAQCPEIQENPRYLEMIQPYLPRPESKPAEPAGCEACGSSGSCGADKP